jgi:hypothetical protein
MRASRFVHVVGLAALLSGAVFMGALHVWDEWLSEGRHGGSLRDRMPGASFREVRTEGAVEQPHLLAEPESVEGEGAGLARVPPVGAVSNLGTLFFGEDTLRRVQNEHLLRLLQQEKQEAAGGRLARISDVVVPILGISDNSRVSADYRSEGRSIDMSSGFIQKLFQLRGEETWMDDLPVVGMRVEEDQLTDEYTVKGFKVGLPGKTLWLVHEPLQDDGDAEATYIELRKAW